MPLPAGRPTVLVVDDEPVNRELMLRHLGSDRYEIEEAGDGETALSAILARAPDLILLDVQMPGMDGFEVCRRIKQHPASRLTPVVLVTGLNDRRSKIKGIEVGADDS